MLGMVTTSDHGTTGIKDLADALGGGLKEGSLVVIEGEPKTGKSILAQHIVYGLLRGHATHVAYYSTEHNARSLMDQMYSFGLDVDRDVVADRLRTYRVRNRPVVTNGPKVLQGLLDHMAGIPEEFRTIIFDSPSWFMTHTTPMIKIDFLHVCKEVCDAGRTMVIIVDTHVFETRSLARAFSISDYYLRLRNYDSLFFGGQVDLRVIKQLSIAKLGGVNRQGDDDINFEIKPRVGIHLLPFLKVKV